MPRQTQVRLIFYGNMAQCHLPRFECSDDIALNDGRDTESSICRVFSSSCKFNWLCWIECFHFLHLLSHLPSLLIIIYQEPFREPVDWQALGLFDYPQVIKKPMDLGLVKKKLNEGKYKTIHDAADDIRLIWKNCMAYNADGSDFYNLAQVRTLFLSSRYLLFEIVDGRLSQKLERNSMIIFY